MSDRTYLDVIVEEEIKRVRYIPGDLEGIGKIMGDTIARRAFAHGVIRDQEVNGDKLHYLGTPLVWNVSPAPAPPPLPTPPPGFKHTDGKMTMMYDASWAYAKRQSGVGQWLWAPGTRPVLVTETLRGALCGYILEGPPPVPRFEHTGEYRHPKRDEWILTSNSVCQATGSMTDLHFWIMRKVEP